MNIMYDSTAILYLRQYNTTVSIRRVVSVTQYFHTPSPPHGYVHFVHNRLLSYASTHTYLNIIMNLSTHFSIYHISVYNVFSSGFLDGIAY